MKKFRLYLAHPFDLRHEIREWELRKEFTSGLELVNPFYDAKRDDISAIDRGEKDRLAVSSEKIVRGDLNLIKGCDGLVAFVPGCSTSIGTIMEIVYAWISDKSVFIIAENGRDTHPWIQQHADEVYMNREDFPGVFAMNVLRGYEKPRESRIGPEIFNIHRIRNMIIEYKLQEDCVGIPPAIANPADDYRKLTQKEYEEQYPIDKQHKHFLPYHKTIYQEVEGLKVESGEQRGFTSGAKRQNATGKGLPMLVSPFVIEVLAKHCERGVLAGYEPRNWEQGIPIEEFLNSAYRHLLAIHEGKTDEDHEAALVWNIMGVIHTREMIRRGALPKELDYNPNYGVKK